MTQSIVLLLISIAGIIAASMLVLIFAGGVKAAKRFEFGALHWYFPATLVSGALVILLSGRNFSLTGALTGEVTGGGSSVAIWAIRLTSLFAMVAALDVVIRRFTQRQLPDANRALFLGVFVIFWLTTMASPGLLGYRPRFEHSFAYSLILGMGCICLTECGGIKVMRMCRDMAVVFCLVSFMVLPIAPNLVVDATYSQGYLPGVPRFAGLAPHAVGLGALASLGIWGALANPYERRSVQIGALLLCMLAVVLAQAKAVWLNLLVSVPVILLYRWRHATELQGRTLGRSHSGVVALLGVVIVSLLGVWVAAMSADVARGIDRFLDSGEGAQLLSLTGRDRIWAVALDEWRSHPVFGYGLTLFDGVYRLSIGMSFATHGHNQLVDTLGRSGLVGAAGLVVYVVLLGYWAMRCAKASHGLTIALFSSLFLRGVSEVPLQLANIGAEAIPHFLLLALVAQYMGGRPVNERAVDRQAKFPQVGGVSHA